MNGPHTFPVQPVSRPRVRLIAGIDLAGWPELELAAYASTIPAALLLAAWISRQLAALVA